MTTNLVATIEKAKGAALAVRVEAAVRRALDEKRVVGAVVLVARDGEVVLERAFGLADRERGVPMRVGTPFRYASLTKPVVAATTMGLAAEGALSLDDEVARWLPEFRPTYQGRPARIALRHLLTHTSGLSYGFFEPASGPYHAANVSDGLDQPGLSLEENLRRLGGVPLAFAPGAAFLYSLGYDVLGAVLAKAGRASLPDVVARVVLRPLGLSDAGFVAPAGLPLATPYANGAPEPTRIEDGAVVTLFDGGVTFAPSRAFDARSYPSGGAGMYGTGAAFLRFLEALRTRRGLVPAPWLHAMSRDQIGSLVSPILGEGWGYAFGAAVLRDPVAAQSPMHAGTLRWGGAYGHSWWIDPQAKTSAVLLTNTAFEGMVGALRPDMEHALFG